MLTETLFVSTRSLFVSAVRYWLPPEGVGPGERPGNDHISLRSRKEALLRSANPLARSLALGLSRT